MKKSFIIIDDNSQQRIEVSKILNSEGFNVFPGVDTETTFWQEIENLISRKSSGNLLEKYFNGLTPPITPVCFIIDISLKGATDTYGISPVGNDFIKVTFPQSKIIYYTKHDTNQVEGLIGEGNQLVYKGTSEEDIIKFKTDIKLALFSLFGNEKLNSFKQNSGTSPQGDINTSENVPIPTPFSAEIVSDLANEKIHLQEVLNLREQRKENRALEIKIENLNTKNFYIDKIICILFVSIITLAAFFLVYFAIFHVILMKCWYKEEPSVFKIIENIFISPLPLIIVFTFYNYYKSVLQPILIERKINTHDQKASAMLDISITKYLFASLLFSTILVALFEKFMQLTNITKFELTAVSDSSHITLLQDSIKYISANPVIYKLNNSNSIHIYGFAIAGILLLLLIFYILRLEKHISGKKKESTS